MPTIRITDDNGMIWIEIARRQDGTWHATDDCSSPDDPIAISDPDLMGNGVLRQLYDEMGST